MSALRRQLWLLAFFDEFVPLYALFALWFVDNGISTAQISLVYALWAVAVLVLEIPSGALADRVNRPRLIAAAYVVRVAAIAAWLLLPTLTGVIIGALLWAVHDSLASGAWEAMIHDELSRLGEEAAYPSVMARLAQAAWVAVAVSAVTAWALVPIIGVVGVGWTSVALLSVALLLVLRLPGAKMIPTSEDHAANADGPDSDGTDSAVDQPAEFDEEPTSFRAWLATLKAGVAEARSNPVLGRLIVIGALAENLVLFEEYIPFLARRGGAPDHIVPIILGLAWLGFAVGAEVAARRPALSGRVLAALTALGVVTAVVAIAGRGSAYLVICLVFLHMASQAGSVLADARLQERASARHRATVTSVRGFLVGVLALVGFTMMSVLDRAGDVRPGLFALLIPAALLVWLIYRGMPDALDTRGDDERAGAPATG